jgi:hypothetical protein
VVKTFDMTFRYGSITNTCPVIIGQSFDLGSIPFNGEIDEVQLFNCALDSTTIAALHRADSRGACKPGTTDAPEPEPRAAAIEFASLSNNPVTSGAALLRFGLARADRVQIRVFDVTGRAVRGITARRYEAGEHTAVWDGRDEHGGAVPRGIYFAEVRFAGSGFRKALKLVLLR